MFNEHLYCVIEAGGIGSRFWPISRAAKPKQFLDFEGDGASFLRSTYDRMRTLVPDENILIVSLERYKERVMKCIPELKEENLLLEPYNRNTAPCLTFATYTLLKRDPLATVIATPADHAIGNIPAFNETLSSAVKYAAGTDALITIGIVPNRPDSNFGYIQVAGPFEGDRPVKVKTFTEKPDKELAKVFIDSGEFLWNSGIFIWRASTIREELEKHASDITRLWKGWKEYLCTDQQQSFIERIYTDMPRVSIDVAVMEKTDNAWVYPAKFNWADIGNWESLYDHLVNHDKSGNASNIRGKGLLKESSNNIIFSSADKKLVAVRGMENFLVVDMKDVLLICPRDEEKLTEFLSELAMPEYEEYR